MRKIILFLLVSLTVYAAFFTEKDRKRILSRIAWSRVCLKENGKKGTNPLEAGENG